MDWEIESKILELVTQIVTYNKIISKLIKELFYIWINKTMLLIFDHRLMESSQWLRLKLIQQKHRVWKTTRLLSWTQMVFIKVILLMVIISKVLLCQVMVIAKWIINQENNWRKQSLMKDLLLQTALGHRLIGHYNKISLQDRYQVDRMITQLIKDKVVMEVMLSYQTKIVKCKIIIQNFILILKLAEVIIQGLLLL